MATIREISGRTLRLAGRRGEAAPRTVRLSVVRRSGLWGDVFNVRESRAEPGPGQTLRLLGAGRLLSWRWVPAATAQRVLNNRLTVLTGLGYRDLEPASARGEWDWLQELTARAVSGGPQHAAVLRDAVLGLGLAPQILLVGLASIVDLPVQALEHPAPHNGHEPDLPCTAAIVSVLAEHPQLNEVAARWLTLPRFPYEIDARTLVGWLEADGPISRALAPRLPAEGLALVGVDGLRRLGLNSGSAAVRRAALDWNRHLA